MFQLLKITLKSLKLSKENTFDARKKDKSSLVNKMRLLVRPFECFWFHALQGSNKLFLSLSSLWSIHPLITSPPTSLLPVINCRHS